MISNYLSQHLVFLPSGPFIFSLQRLHFASDLFNRRRKKVYFDIFWRKIKKWRDLDFLSLFEVWPRPNKNSFFNFPKWNEFFKNSLLFIISAQTRARSKVWCLQRQLPFPFLNSSCGLFIYICFLVPFLPSTYYLPPTTHHHHLLFVKGLNRDDLNPLPCCWHWFQYRCH